MIHLVVVCDSLFFYLKIGDDELWAVWRRYAVALEQCLRCDTRSFGGPVALISTGCTSVSTTSWNNRCRLHNAFCEDHAVSRSCQLFYPLFHLVVIRVVGIVQQPFHALNFRFEKCKGFEVLVDVEMVGIAIVCPIGSV